MKTKLITFGDSWPYGAELKANERPFGFVLADILAVDIYQNLSIGGTSADSMVYELDKYIKSIQDNCTTIAVFYITGLSRVMFLDNDGQPKCYKVPPSVNHFSQEPDHIYFKYFHSYYQDMFNAQRTILCLQSMCYKAGIKDFYLPGFKPVDLNFSGLDSARNYPKTCLELFGIAPEDELDDSVDNPYICSGGNHPNQLGHNLIAQTLGDWIKSVQSKI